MLWLSAVLVTAFALFPNYVGSVVGGTTTSAVGAETASLVLGVRGMTCAGCESTVEQALSSVQGVVEVKASYQDETAVVTVEHAAATSTATIFAALGNAGYELTSVAGEAVHQKASLSGHWIAEVILADSTRVDLVIDLDRLSSRWVGEFDVSEFGVENYPVEVTLSATAVKLHLAGPDADFDGTLSEDGTNLAGVLNFADELLRTELRRTGEPQFSEMFLQLEAAADDSTLVGSLSGNGVELRQRFNADADKARLLMLLSPT